MAVFCLRFDLKPYILEAIECLPFFDPKSPDARTKTPLLTKFSTDFPEILCACAKLMLYKVPKFRVDICTLFLSYWESSLGGIIPPSQWRVKHKSQDVVKMSGWGITENVLILLGIAPMGICMKRPGILTLALWGLRQIFIWRLWQFKRCLYSRINLHCLKRW